MTLFAHLKTVGLLCLGISIRVRAGSPEACGLACSGETWGLASPISELGLEVSGNVVNRHRSPNPWVNILSSKQLEVFEVLFGAYSSEPLCQGGIFIIKRKES